MKFPWLPVCFAAILFTSILSMLLSAKTQASTASIDNEWKATQIVGRFEYSVPPKPDQVFKVYYKMTDGSIENLSIAQTQVNGSDKARLDIKFLRNYPYTNEVGVITQGQVSPLIIINNQPVDELAYNYITECFFIFSIPFSGNKTIGLVWDYLLTNLPYHGDEIPDTCLPQTVVVNVPTKKDGTITPLHQFKASVAAEDTLCPSYPTGDSLLLLISPKGKPYCVKLTDEGFMKRHGWTEP